MFKASKYLIIIILTAFPVIFYSCSASTGSRYDKNNEEKKEKTAEKTEESSKTELKEDFDITPYRTKIEIDESTDLSPKENVNAWYNYEETIPDTAAGNKTVIEKVDGYRVQVLSTDNLEDANAMRSEIYFKTNQKAVYIDFDPPFYKVNVGDFTDLNDANNFSFKLNQMGYNDARVVREEVNVFK